VAPQRSTTRAARAENGEPRYPIESVDKALRLLLVLAQRRTLSVSEASAELEVAPSTAHRLLAMLRHWNFAEQNAATKQYVPGRALIDLATLTLRSVDVQVEARRFLERLVAQFDETAHLTTLRGRDVVFLSVVESSQVLRIGSRVGHVLPAHCTAAGKALLAQLSDEQLELLYPEDELPGITPGSITARTDLLAEIAAIRIRGYDANHGESEPDLTATAAAFSDKSGIPGGAITVSAPRSRMPEERISEIGKAVAAATNALAESLP
jgi:DNA-binding IclR family transcriptional regulator